MAKQREQFTHTEPLSRFWYWINERHQIYLNRQAGQPKPWTTDVILQDYKFTNVFRELDAGTVWLRENFREPYADASPELLAFNICWYRKFNFIPTAKIIGWQEDWDEAAIIEKLRPHSGGKLLTGAHFNIARPYVARWVGMVEVCTDLWDYRHKIAKVAQEYNSLEMVFDVLCQIDYIGPFLAYEMVSDMRWTKLLENATDINTWANPGDGARRGLRRLGLKARPDIDAIENMQELLAMSRSSLGSHVPPLELRDIEHSLCETDKYCRVFRGEGAPRSKYNGRA